MSKLNEGVDRALSLLKEMTTDVYGHGKEITINSTKLWLILCALKEEKI